MSDDLIRRSDAIEALGEEPYVWTDDDEFAQGERSQWIEDVSAIKAVPSADRPNATEIMNAYHEGVRKGIAEAYEAYGADRPQGWIPCEERLPESGSYVLVSFDNSTLADIGRWEVDEDGGGAFYAGDDEKSYVSYGLFVNAWMPLPEPWKGSDDEIN